MDLHSLSYKSKNLIIGGPQASGQWGKRALVKLGTSAGLRNSRAKTLSAGKVAGLFFFSTFSNIQNELLPFQEKPFISHPI